VSGQAPTEADVRDLREMLTVRYGRDEELVVLCDAYLAQRDVVDAATHFIDLAYHDYEDAAYKRLAAAVAAVVSGTPAEEQT
jgi:hypothetical protein